MNQLRLRPGDIVTARWDFVYRDENGNFVLGEVCHLGQLLTVIATNIRYPDRVLIVATGQGMGWTFVSNLTRRTGVRQR